MEIVVNSSNEIQKRYSRHEGDADVVPCLGLGEDDPMVFCLRLGVGRGWIQERNKVAEHTVCRRPLIGDRPSLGQGSGDKLIQTKK